MHLTASSLSQNHNFTEDQYVDCFSFLFMLIPLVTFECHLYVNASQLYTCNLLSPAIQLHIYRYPFDIFTSDV